MSEVTIFGKPGCCLCDEAREVVLAVGAERAFRLLEVDVTVDPILHRRYGERVPVIAVDGEELFEFYVEAEALRAALDGDPPPVE